MSRKERNCRLLLWAHSRDSRVWLSSSEWRLLCMKKEQKKRTQMMLIQKYKKLVISGQLINIDFLSLCSSFVC